MSVRWWISTLTRPACRRARPRAVAVVIVVTGVVCQGGLALLRAFDRVGMEQGGGGLGALIFDCDGTLVDTETPYMLAFNQALAQTYMGTGLPPALAQDAWGRDCSGRGLEYDAEYAVSAFPLSCNASAFKARWVQNFAAMTAKKGSISLMEGFDALYAHARKMGWKVAVASSSDGTGLAMKLRNGVIAHSHVVSGLDDFDVIVSNDDVRRHKPDPEIYRVAAQRLGLRPSACWVVEDTATGVLAGRRAGMHVLAVPSDYTRGTNDFSKADYVLANMGEAVQVLDATLGNAK